MPKSVIDARPIQPREVGIAVMFYVNPALLRSRGLDKTEELTPLIEQLVDEQFALARSRLVAAVFEYVQVDQVLIDKTRG